MTVIFKPLGSTALKTDMILSTLPEIINECRLKLYHTKKKPYVNMTWKPCCLLWTKLNLKWMEAN